MSYMFSGCKSLISLNLSSINTCNATNMSSLFCEFSSLKLIYFVSSFNANNVNNMSSIFHNYKSLNNLNLSSFNTSKVTKMSYIFFGCSSLYEINFSFNISNIN